MMRLVFLVVVASLVSLGHVNVDAQQTFVVQVGSTTPAVPVNTDVHTQYTNPNYEWTFMKFYPSSITINVGDIISFQQTRGQMDSFHTINFNPLVPGPNGTMSPFYPVGGPPPNNASLAFPPFSQFYLSPQIGNNGTGTGDQRQRFVHNGNTTYIASGFFAQIPAYNSTGFPAFNITFNAAGTWLGYCAIHSPDMTISVTVNPANTPYPQTPQQVMTAAQGEYGYDQNSAPWRNRIIGRDDKLLLPVAASEFPSGFTPQGGQYVVRVGTDLMGGATHRFIPENIEINVGDVLHFYSEDDDVHTVTINGSNVDFSTRNTALAPGTVIFADFPSTPGNLTNPYVFDGYAHSGLILNEALQNTPYYPYFFLKSPFSVRFNTVGTFHLQCLIHAGMEGRIVVKPSGTCAQQASVVNINFANMFGK